MAGPFHSDGEQPYQSHPFFFFPPAAAAAAASASALCFSYSSCSFRSRSAKSLSQRSWPMGWRRVKPGRKSERLICDGAARVSACEGWMARVRAVAHARSLRTHLGLAVHDVVSDGLCAGHHLRVRGREKGRHVGGVSRGRARAQSQQAERTMNAPMMMRKGGALS